MSGPVVFVSDLGLRDEFVGVCHLVIARIAPDARVVDLSHGVPRHDIQSGAMMLANGMAHAGPYAVGLGIVDPGVGTGRRAIAVATADGPAAGRARQRPAVAGVEVAGRRDGRDRDRSAGGRVNVRVRRCSTARDVFAPAAAHLAAGAPLDRLGVALDPGDPGDDDPRGRRVRAGQDPRPGRRRRPVRQHPAQRPSGRPGQGRLRRGLDGRGGDDGDVRPGAPDRGLRRRPSRASTGCSSTRGTGWR